jgi:hypothetical protein
MRKIGLFIAAALVIILGGCSKDLPVAKYTIQGIVKDSRTGEPITGALFEILTARKTVTKDSTDINGFVKMKDLDMGTYYIKVSEAGYMTIKRISTSPNNNVSDVQYKWTACEQFNLDPADFSCKITVNKLYPQGGSLYSPVPLAFANQNVLLSFPNSIYVDEFTATTDASGIASFSGVSQSALMTGAAQITLLGTLTEGNIIFDPIGSVTGSISDLSVTFTGTIPNASLSIVSCSFLDAQGKGLESVAVSQNIDIKFNEAIDTAGFSNPNQTLIALSTGFFVSVAQKTPILSEGNTRVVISTRNDLTRNTTYSLSVNVVSADKARNLSRTIQFKTAK